ncbi:15-hydroxyprostaglandin dehydrogenase [Pyrenochaeta sp. DS3sAY3a]|nr:15-hydroxyprostaglandin dehydrogenase [Pyrenochaeta sp. DS3sAY3a]
MPGDRKVVLVTGGASGIGLGAVHLFAEQGAHVCMVDVSQQVSEVDKTLASEYPQASFSFHKANVADWDQLAEIFEKVYDEQGRIDIVFANAGISREISFILDEEKPSKPQLPTLEVNLIGVLNTVKLATHYIKKNEIVNEPRGASRGSIVCTSSIAALYPFPIAPIYAASKAGVVGLVRSLAAPLEKVAIQINSVAPAFIATNLGAGAENRDSFGKIILTPMSTLTRGLQQLVSDPSLSGQVAVVHGDSITLSPPPQFVDEDTGRDIDILWSSGVKPAGV